MDFQRYNEHPNIVLHYLIDDFYLYSPRITIRHFVRSGAEEHLREKFSPGVYSGKQATMIANHMFNYYDLRIDNIIKKISKAFFLYFALFQYDKAAKVQELFKKGHLSSEHQDFWQAHGPMYRRTIGYLIDKLVINLNSPFNNTTPPIESYSLLDEAFICCENAIKYSTISNEIHYLNQSYKIEIHPINSQYFITNIDTSESKEYTERHNYYVDQSTRDISLRSQNIKGIPFERDWKEHGRILNKSFKKVFDLTYHEIMFTMSDIIIKTREIKSVNNIPLVLKSDFITDMSNHFKSDNKKIEQFFEGLILRKSQFQKNTRTVWKYKQPYRINKRPFIELKKGKKIYLTWSNEMLKERLNQLDTDFVFKTIPPEWMKTSIQESTDIISNKAGLWFEKQVKLNLNELGIVGDKIKDKLIQTSVLCNSKEVGGFDFLGYCPNSNKILVIECKYMDSGFEPRSYYDDFRDFNNSERGYITKLNRKVNWLLDNFDEVKKELSVRLSFPIPDSCDTVGAAFFTYVMTFAYAFIKEYPCVSFTDFISNYDKSKCWYFDKGIFKK